MAIDVVRVHRNGGFLHDIILLTRCIRMFGHTYSESMYQTGVRVANPARGQLNRENEYFPVSVRA